MQDIQFGFQVSVRKEETPFDLVFRTAPEGQRLGQTLSLVILPPSELSH
jgi:hypothetical protein